MPELEKLYENENQVQYGMWRGYNTQDEYKEALAIITFELYLTISRKGMPKDLQYIQKLNEGAAYDPFRRVNCGYEHTIGWKAFFEKGVKEIKNG